MVADGLTGGTAALGGKHERPSAPEKSPVAPDGDTPTTVIAIPEAIAAPRAEIKPRVVLLGLNELNRELAVALRRFGAEVIAIDGYANVAAHGVADQSLVVSLTDADELAAVIRRLEPEFVAATTGAISVDALEGLEALTGAKTGVGKPFTELVPSARSLRLAADPEGLRRLAADELGLPTAPFWFVGSLGELQAVAIHAGFPLLIKPVAGGVGRGKSLVAGPDDVERAWQHATGGTNRRVLAETKVSIEFHATLFVVCSQAPQGPAIEFCAPIGHCHPDAEELECWQPQTLSSSAMDAAKSIAARIVTALGGRGVFSVELMVNGDEVYLVDVSPCPLESTWVTLRTQRLSAFELQARAILGFNVDAMMISPGAARVITAVSAGGPTPDSLTDALAVAESDVRVFGRSSADGSGDAPRRLGVALATAPDVATARNRARQVASALRGCRQL